MGALDAGCFEDGLQNRIGLEEEVEDMATAEAAKVVGGSEMDSESDAESTRSIEDAVRVLLQGLGEDHEREGLRRTPHRVAKAFRDGTRGYKEKVKDIVEGALFPEAGFETGIDHADGASGLVVVRDINLFSHCESCLLPFSIKCHIGYVPSQGRIVGLSKLSRVADVFAKRLQDPQRLANEICVALHDSVKPAGVSVALQCWHIQFPEERKCNFNTNSLISDKQGWVKVLVSSSSGIFKEEKSSFLDDFFSLLRLRGVVIEKGDATHSHVSHWCPSRSLEVHLSNGHCLQISENDKASSKTTVPQTSMVAAVASILCCVGEDPSRKELLGTPSRYVQWLLNFKSSNSDFQLKDHSVCNMSSYGVTNGNVTSTNGIQLALNLPFCSQCEHHLLPFHGVVHIGYMSKQEGIDVERSALLTMVHFFACKLQVQERLTRQIAEAVYSIFSNGVMVVVEAYHNCMISRGIEKVGSNTATIAVLGQFSSDPKTKSLFFQAIAKNATSGT
ncbi:GTP cyclohydrolase 1-like [Zingiber officinale]|uniref:GTP cyclohydrolase 1 n=1 Tax=Zingiber officinale TaxID=94328 RepID=A0A8J5KDZ3_ZINOF|nr:GTP cyclohydrolase 1-like [Zingiber officinale]KAG6477318.1 hypothetical protein ZIOFF_066571 [Zingiber officinale]